MSEEVQYTYCNNVKEFVQGDPKKEDLIKFYDNWSEKYDLDIKEIKCNAPYHLSDATVKFLSNSRQSRILDLACGTGLTSECLFKQGFTNIDGLDASESMLQIALSKKCYRQIFCEFCEPGGLKSVDDNTYDVVLTTGSIGVPKHVEYKSIEGISKCLKVGGHFILGIRKQYVNFDSDIVKEFERLEENKVWHKISQEEIPGYIGKDAGMIFIFEKM